MKKLLSLLVAVAFVLGMAVPAFAFDIKKSVHKFSEGLIHVVKTPLVLIDHPKSEMDSADNPVLGLTTGLVTTPFHLVKHAGSGVIDMATFPIE